MFELLMINCANKPLWYGFWLPLPNLLTNLLFLRIKAFWGGQLCCLQIDLSRGCQSKVHLEFRKKSAFMSKLTTPIELLAS